MPAISITGGSRGTRTDVQPRVRSLSRDRGTVLPSCRSLIKSLQGIRVTREKVTINDTQGRDTSIDRGTMDDSVEGDRIDARKVEDSLLHRLRINGVSKARLNSCTSWGRVRVLSNNARNVERPGGRPLDTPFYIDVTLPRLPTLTKDKGCAKGYELTPPVPRRLYPVYLSPTSESAERERGFPQLRDSKRRQ